MTDFIVTHKIGTTEPSMWFCKRHTDWGSDPSPSYPPQPSCHACYTTVLVYVQNGLTRYGKLALHSLTYVLISCS
jgi:hypothetical protein